MYQSPSPAHYTEDTLRAFQQQVRRPALRAASATDLRRLRRELTIACDALRKDAISAISLDTPEDHCPKVLDKKRCFAELFDALRRVRSELTRRQRRSGAS